MINLEKYPILDKDSVFPYLRKNCQRPEKLESDQDSASYLASANDDRIAEFQLYSPKITVSRYEGGFDGFRVIFKNYVLVFVVIDGYVMLTGEWKHGSEKITIVPACGVVGKDEKPREAAVREIEEEMGVKIETWQLSALSSNEGIAEIVFNASVKYYPFFINLLSNQVEFVGQKLGRTEKLLVIRIKLEEWLIMMLDHQLWDSNPDFNLEACTRDTSMAVWAKLLDLKNNLKFTPIQPVN